MQTSLASFMMMMVLTGQITAYSQDKAKVSPPEVSIKIVHIIPIVKVRVTITNSSANPLCIPTEGELYGEPQASFGHVHLESHGPRGWGWPPHNSSHGLLGVSPPKGSLTINPSESKTLVVAIPVDYFVIKPRQRLRLVFLAWPNDSSFSYQSSTFQIASPEFMLP